LVQVRVFARENYWTDSDMRRTEDKMRDAPKDQGREEVIKGAPGNLE
jgi:hypothetical protein